MFLARFDDDTAFFDFLTAKGGTPERYHVRYPVGDPPTSWNIYPIARATDGTWAATLDLPIDSEDTRWQDSQRLAGWGW
jgi:hypothetical protein